jgi:hypothetical protein
LSGSSLPEPLWLVLAPPSLLGSRSRHCYGINYTHPMKKDVKKKSFSPPLEKMRVW